MLININLLFASFILQFTAFMQGFKVQLAPLTLSAGKHNGGSAGKHNGRANSESGIRFA